MLGASLTVLLYILSCLIIILMVLNILIRQLDAYWRKKLSDDRESTRQKIEIFVGGPETEFESGLKELKAAVNNNLKYRNLVDEYLLFAIGDPGAENRERLITIARRLDFYSECQIQIINRNPEIAARGARKAGLYHITEAAGDMAPALDILSGENQYEILMALARIGAAEALGQAFEKIGKNLLINERAAIEILSALPDSEDKTKLFKGMIRGDSHFIAGLCLKAMKSEMAKELSEDIVTVLHEGNKELRLAAVKSLSTLGYDAPAEELIKALEDDEWEVRALAAKALEFAGGEEASMALYSALHDQQWWVRQNSANALIRHSNYEPLFILAAESGDEYSRDSITAVLEKSNNVLLLRSIRLMSMDRQES